MATSFLGPLRLGIHPVPSSIFRPCVTITRAAAMTRAVARRVVTWTVTMPMASAWVHVPSGRWVLCAFVRLSMWIDADDSMPPFASLPGRVGAPGFEPGTSALSGLRSNQLSYAPLAMAGNRRRAEDGAGEPVENVDIRPPHLRVNAADWVLRGRPVAIMGGG